MLLWVCGSTKSSPSSNNSFEMVLLVCLQCSYGVVCYGVVLLWQPSGGPLASSCRYITGQATHCSRHLLLENPLPAWMTTGPYKVN